MSSPHSVGFYGKLPSHGDFLRRRVSDSFVTAWDEWLQESMSCSRERLADRWLDVYLTSPAWRFACGPGACGPATVVGVLVPSVDRVGRYFPLAVAAELDLPEAGLLVPGVAAAASFFEHAERLLIDTLATEQIEFDHFDEAVGMLTEHLTPLVNEPVVVLDATARAILTPEPRACWHMPMGTGTHPGDALQQILSQQLSAAYNPLGLWWTAGSSSVQPSCLITAGLVPPDGFGSMLDGSWEQSRWQSVGGQTVEDNPTSPTGPPIERLYSVAATAVGRSRSTHHDSVIERPEIGVWAVADGLGGSGHAKIASRMMCDALGDYRPDASFDDMAYNVSQRIGDVNNHLRRQPGTNLADRGTAVVALLARGEQYAVLAAGSCRAYRVRGDRCTRLTPEPEGRRHAPNLDLALHRDWLAVGDRFVLCSEGLTDAVPEADIPRLARAPDLPDAVYGLISAAQHGRAPDEVTVLMVEARGAS